MMNTLTNRLITIQARADAATPGPWDSVCGYDGHGGGILAEIDGETWDIDTDDDKRFIAAARTDLPALLAVIRKLIEQRDSETVMGTESHSRATKDIESYNAELLNILEEAHP